MTGIREGLTGSEVGICSYITEFINIKGGEGGICKSKRRTKCIIKNKVLE